MTKSDAAYRMFRPLEDVDCDTRDLHSGVASENCQWSSVVSDVQALPVEGEAMTESLAGRLARFGSSGYVRVGSSDLAERESAQERTASGPARHDGEAPQAESTVTPAER